MLRAETPKGSTVFDVLEVRSLIGLVLEFSTGIRNCLEQSRKSHFYSYCFMFLKCFYIAVPYMYVLLCVLHLCVIKDDDDEKLKHPKIRSTPIPFPSSFPHLPMPLFLLPFPFSLSHLPLPPSPLPHSLLPSLPRYPLSLAYNFHTKRRQITTYATVLVFLMNHLLTRGVP